jgi:Zn-dependent protease with chaperone function
MYELLGATLVLAMLLTVNAVATFAATGLAMLCKTPLQRCTARTRAEILFVMRTGPPAVAIVWIVTFLIPSYVAYEPRSTNESISLKLAVLALISAAGISFAVWRALRSWWSTRSLLKVWFGAASPIYLKGIDVPSFRFQHAFPIIAVVGMLRPRLFIAEQVLESLSTDELAAAIAHECGHLAAYDNCKRSLLRASRAALLIIPCGRSLDRAWSDASESAADEYAAERSCTMALNLASALVHIARMIPSGGCHSLPAAVSTFLAGGKDTQGVKVRVRRLLELASVDPSQLMSSAPIVRVVPWLFLSLVVVLGMAVESRPQILATVHGFVERVVVLMS